MRTNQQQLLPEPTRIPWLELLETLFRRRRLILATFFAGLILAALLAWTQPPLYKATARIQLAAQALSGPRVEAMTDRQILAELAMLKSPGLLRAMFGAETDSAEGVASAGLRETVSGLLRAPLSSFRGQRGAPIDRFVESRAARIEIDRISNSNVVAVAFTDGDRERAARFVNDLLEHHIERIATLSESAGARTFYETQADLLAEQWRKASEELLAFRREHGAEVSESEVQRVLSTLEAQRVAAETQALELQATIDYLKAQMLTVPETVEGELVERRDDSVGLLNSRLLELKIRRIELLSTYTPDSTVVRDLDRQIADLQKLAESNEDRFVAETSTEPNPSLQTLEVELLRSEAQLNAANARLQALGSQIARYRGRLDRIEVVVAELTRLESAVENAREDYQDYLSQTEQARLESALEAAGSFNITIIERAEVPSSPLPSGNSKLLLGGVFGSLLLGIAVALIRDYLDPTVKGSLQIARLTGLPVIAEIPAE